MGNSDSTRTSPGPKLLALLLKLNLKSPLKETKRTKKGSFFAVFHSNTCKNRFFIKKKKKTLKTIPSTFFLVTYNYFRLY